MGAAFLFMVSQNFRQIRTPRIASVTEICREGQSKEVFNFGQLVPTEHLEKRKIPRAKATDG